MKNSSEMTDKAPNKIVKYFRDMCMLFMFAECLALGLVLKMESNHARQEQHMEALWVEEWKQNEERYEKLQKNVARNLEIQHGLIIALNNLLEAIESSQILESRSR